jgi:Domain of unknown function (DUF2383)
LNLKNPTRAHPGGRDYICMKEQKETSSVLNDLIETLRDGQKGFQEAAEAVKDPQLKSLFVEYSQQRSRFATDLQSQVQSSFATPGRADCVHSITEAATHARLEGRHSFRYVQKYI